MPIPSYIFLCAWIVLESALEMDTAPFDRSLGRSMCLAIYNIRSYINDLVPVNLTCTHTARRPGSQKLYLVR
jgi:hypothetical protein